MKQSYVTIISTFAFLVALLVDFTYQEDTYQLSIRVIKSLQAEDSLIFETLGSVVLFFSMAGNRTITNYVILYLWLKVAKKEQVLKLISMYCFATYLGDIIKMVLISPRPFYLDDQIHLEICQTGFGDPSGHALRTVVFYTILSETLVFKKYKVNANNLGVLSAISRDPSRPFDDHNVDRQVLYEQLYPNSMLTYNQYRLIFFGFILLTGLSRLYFGLHFLNQIVLGWLIGVYLLVLYYYGGLETLLEKLFLAAIHNRSEEHTVKLKTIVKVALSFFILVALSLVIYLMAANSEGLQEQKQIWLEQIGKHENCSLARSYFEENDLVQTTIICLPLYLYLSCHFSTGSYKPELYMSNIFNVKGLLRAAVMMGFMIFVAIIKASCKSIEMPLFVQYFLLGQFFYAQIAILLITALPISFRILRLDDQGDLFRKVTEIEQQEMEL